MTVPWPFPGDNEVDKARRVARDYRSALERVAPELCQQLDEAARRLGQRWVTPELIRFELDDYITLAEAAELVYRTTRAVRYWVAGDNPKLASIVDRRGVRRVRVRDLIDLERDMRTRRTR